MSFHPTQEHSPTNMLFFGSVGHAAPKRPSVSGFAKRKSSSGNKLSV
jgi:hypothetical protein